MALLTIEIPAMTVPVPHDCQPQVITVSPWPDGTLRIEVRSHCGLITCTTTWEQVGGERRRVEASCDNHEGAYSLGAERYWH